jgi:hypoxanthine phosphoribosyltransferase
MIPSHFKLQYSNEAISKRAQELGREMSGWTSSVYNATGKDVIALPVLRGGVFFFADLVRQIEGSVEMVPVQTWAYDTTQNGTQLDSVRVNTSAVAARGRSLLVIDDICDSGRTLAALKQELLKLGAAEVRTAVLIKRILDKPSFDPDWVGFNYNGPEWFVGYGMEDSDRWRNLPSIYVMQPR